MVVDLAGSESLGKTLSDHQTQLEGKDINQSLLVLSRIIVLLSKRKDVFLPWRDSKLTMLLKKCLDGNAHFSFVACLSPL